MAAKHCTTPNGNIVVVSIARASLSDRWSEIYAFLESDTASGTYAIHNNTIPESHAPYRYELAFSNANTAFQFKMRFA